MLTRYTIVLALAVVLAALAGCQQQRIADTSGHGVYLFGPTPLPMGQEDLGYFAVPPQTEPALAMFDHESVYVRSWVWEVEDNRRPGISHHRRRTWTDHRYLFQR